MRDGVEIVHAYEINEVAKTEGSILNYCGLLLRHKSSNGADITGATREWADHYERCLNPLRQLGHALT